MTPLRALHTPRVALQPVTLAGSRFKDYKHDPEGPHQVRRPQIVGNELERLHHLRAMLKQMPPEAAYEMIEFHHNLTLFEAVALAKETGKLMVPNIVLGNILAKTKLSLPRVWSGTMLIFDSIPDDAPYSFRSIVFKAPDSFHGLTRSSALVVEHPDFDLVTLEPDQNYADKYKLSVQDETQLHAMPNFYRRDGICTTDAEFGLPNNIRFEDGSDTVHVTGPLFGYIGLVRRFFDDFLVKDPRTYMRFDTDTISRRFSVALVT